MSYIIQFFRPRRNLIFRLRGYLGLGILILYAGIGPDFDDVGSMAVMHRLVDAGKVKIRTTIACNRTPQCVSVKVAPSVAAARNEELMMESSGREIHNPQTAAAKDKVPVFDFKGVFPSSVHTVGLVMPASVYAKDKFDAGVAALRAAGYKVKCAPRLRFDARPPAADRAADLVDIWTDPEVDLVMCARGGSTAETILPYIDWTRLRTRPNMPFLGFSDITILHNAMLRQGVGHPFSGPTMSSIPRVTSETKAWLRRALAGEPQPPVKLHALRAGAFSGLPCGGHAHRFSVVLRSGDSVSPKGRVVLLESECSIGVKVLRETLDYLVAAGHMEGVRGVIFGDMTPGSDTPQLDGRELHGAELEAARTEVEKLKREFTGRISCPVYDGFDYGHGNANLTMDHLRAIAVDDAGVLRVL